MTYWKPKQKAKVARLAKIRQHHLSEILYRKREVSKYKAQDLVEASTLVLGYEIPLDAWLFNKTTKHPAFYNDPISDKSESTIC